jgi:hypothetical protein
MVFGDIPIALLTARTPPHPYARDSAAAHCRRIRSSINALREQYFASIARNTASSCMTVLNHSLKK